MPEVLTNRGVNHPRLFYEYKSIIDMPEGPEMFECGFGLYAGMRQEMEKNPDLRPWRPHFDRKDTNGEYTYNQHWDELNGTDQKKEFQKQFKVINGELRHISELGVAVMVSDSSSSNDDDDDNTNKNSEVGDGTENVSPVLQYKQTSLADDAVNRVDDSPMQDGGTMHDDPTTQGDAITQEDRTIQDDGTMQNDASSNQSQPTAQTPDAATTTVPTDVPGNAPANATAIASTRPTVPPPAQPTTNTPAANTAIQASQPTNVRKCQRPMTAGLGPHKASIKTDDPSDSEFEILVRELRKDRESNIRRSSYYRLKPGHKGNKTKLNWKNKRKAERFTKQGRSTYEDARRRNRE